MRKLQYSASLLRLGGPPFSNTIKNELNQKRFDFFSWGFKNAQILENSSVVSVMVQLFCFVKLVGLFNLLINLFIISKYSDYWQKKLHPDLVHTKSKEEREYAAEQSARVTTAFRTLSDPIERAIYILKLGGVVADEEERISDPELLSEVFIYISECFSLFPSELFVSSYDHLLFHLFFLFQPYL
ncbi:chaperone [Lithospermum erythrorhizon]|uniref:Chaperone n=1 Tax=Lithospermum erythrorhizon TaxID=34254 RepID=A0AAV3PB41_LITER